MGAQIGAMGQGRCFVCEEVPEVFGVVEDISVASASFASRAEVDWAALSAHSVEASEIYQPGVAVSEIDSDTDDPEPMEDPPPPMMLAPASSAAGPRPPASQHSHHSWAPPVVCGEWAAPAAAPGIFGVVARAPALPALPLGALPPPPAAAPAPCNYQHPGFAPPSFNAPQIRAESFSIGAGGPPHAQHSSAAAALPSPEAIQKQKDGYIRLLDEQLKQGQATLDQQRKQQTEYLYQQAQQQKQQVEMQIKQQVQQQEMQLLQQYNQQLMQVQQASSQQKVALEQQAMQLTMEYQQKKSQEEMLAKQAQLQREHVDAQMKFAQEMQKLQQVPLGP